MGETVPAVLLPEGPTAVLSEIVELVNGKLADHQRISGYTVWPEEDFPKTHTMKVRGNLVIDYLKAASQGSESRRLTHERPASADTDPLVRIISQVVEVSVQEVELGKTLAGDLGLDSLKRVELLSVIEQELNTYLDEAHLGPSTTVAELGQLVAKQTQGSGPGLSF